MAQRPPSDTAQAKLGLRLRTARRELGLSQAQVAEETGLGRVAISEIEGGRRKVSSLELAALAKLYAHDPEYFLEVATPAAPTYGEAPRLGILARTTRQLSDQDQEQVLRFAEYLRQEARQRERSSGD